MQQNTSFKLDRISIDDDFSPKTLNDNAAQVEAALNTMSTMMVAGDTALRTDLDGVDQRLTLLEAKKIVVGTYVGEDAVSSSKPHVVSLDFTPFAVIVQGNNAIVTIMAIQGAAGSSLWILDGGFAVTRGQTSDLDAKNATYRFLAFG